MISMRPYLLRALYEWIVDNGLTPYLVVNAEYDKVEVPRQYVEDGKIILNISPTATQGLNLDKEWVSFNARFSGRTFAVFVPIQAVLAIYAKENGRGMAFQPEPEEEGTTPSPPTPQPPPRPKPVLKRVK